MAWGLPKLPGMNFSDPTKTRYHLPSSLKYCQGYRCPDSRVKGIGGAPTDADSNAFTGIEDSVNYDPSMTYGRVKQPAPPAVVPHWVHYDKRCLRFKAFMKQSVFENPEESYRIRFFDILYYLEDDTMFVIEPRVKNSGLWQGRFLKRGKIPKNDLGQHWHWKDLNVGMDICLNGAVFHIVSCDVFTKEFMASQGIEMAAEEEMPVDPHSEHEAWKKIKLPPRGERGVANKMRQFLEYEGRNLGFHCIWDDRDAEHGEVRECKLIYFLEDNTVAIKELYDNRGGRDPFPLLLKRSRLPKRWKETPVTEYYSPCDLMVGNTIYVYGRRFLICDCDPYTRNYFKSMLNIEQPPAIDFRQKPPEQKPMPLPPHIYIGSPEDTLQSCLGMMPKPPHRDLIKAAVNMNKYLRYLLEIDWVHPEDKGRRFVMMYSLSDDTIRLTEIRRKNSGIMEGKFLRAMRIQTPDSDPNFPTYYNPNMFYIGAIIPILKHRFRVIGCDLYVYRYMVANKERFSQDVIDSVRNYHLLQGNLKRDLEEAIEEEQEERDRAAKAERDSPAQAEPTQLQVCARELGVDRPCLPAPPSTTDRISYDHSLRLARQSQPTCDNVQPLKGILKTGSARDDQQKVVCFSGPGSGGADDHFEPVPREVPPYEPPEHVMAPEQGFCDKYKDLGLEEHERRRSDGVCPYPPSPTSPASPALTGDAAPPLPYLTARGVDCSKTPGFMHLLPSEHSTALLPYEPDISPAAARVKDHPRAPTPSVADCLRPEAQTPGACPRKPNEDVAFACPHPEPLPPCCNPEPLEPTTKNG